MAANCRRPRLGSGLIFAAVAALALTACSLLKQENATGQEQAANLVQAGKHAEAAQAYAELAQDLPADHDNYQLLSAEQWLMAGNVAAAKQAFAQSSADARVHLPTARALVAAEIAYSENDGARAIQELDQIGVPSSPAQAQSYWLIRGRSAFLTAHPVEGTRAMVERERSLADPKALRANREELFKQIEAAAERGQSLKPPAKTDPVVAGWLAMGPVAMQFGRDPKQAAGALNQWQKSFPEHPANDSVLSDSVPSAAQNIPGATMDIPAQIALLLPLSGRAETAGVAVRDGFIAAYLGEGAALRPRLRVYDVAAESVGAAYAQAMSDGAGVIVGPLTKDDVAAIVPLSAGHTPVLALNFLSDSVSPARDFYQFALLPEDEARMVARRVATDGRLHGVVIVPDGEWGNRVAAAFTEELTHAGGAVLDTRRYETARVDFSNIIKQVLQVRAVKGEPVTHRTDAAFVFVAGTPSAMRQIMPQLKFHYAGDVPVYSTSDSYEPDASANHDIDGLLFPDMPWMLASDGATLQIRDAVRTAWPTRTARRDRLYAFGYDAYRLLPALRAQTAGETRELSGMTGKLHIDEHNRIRRNLQWAQIKGGTAGAL